jgi:hypothetical protein
MHRDFHVIGFFLFVVLYDVFSDVAGRSTDGRLKIKELFSLSYN